MNTFITGNLCLYIPDSLFISQFLHLLSNLLLLLIHKSFVSDVFSSILVFSFLFLPFPLPLPLFSFPLNIYYVFWFLFTLLVSYTIEFYVSTIRQCSELSSYSQPHICTSWVTTAIVGLTYDQILEL